ncbi:hypothetical protein Poli38472_004479 [Pythium oligandrum]|uniref:Uncharacterized protein n=1 Tax=Pythium oligandrum TaxID=41045 RepID=A0A8K1CAB7_PYTOL|nr:hypothetical protein Poli38472_004479 [Pythium oligandrum]|eukprot:TMW59410.1 hypothetical protein Poli38472_004479 [Pythium oligandrum]
MCQVQIATQSCRLAKPASVKMSPGCKQMKVTTRSAPVITIKKDAACRFAKRIATEASGEDLDLEVNLLRHTVSEMQHQVNAAARQIQDIRSLLTQYMATQ